MNIRIIFTLMIIAFTQHAFTACLPYEPALVTVSGKLTRETYPGPPNYEDISKGDAEETGFYLSLPKPICTAGDSSGSEESFASYPQENITTIQLVIDKSGYEALRPYLGKEISLQGTLFAAHTGHHHAPVLISNVTLLGK